MLNLSVEPRTADQQLRAVIFYLTTFGHIDGEFDVSERHFVRDYIEKLVSHRVESMKRALGGGEKAELVRKYTAHFHEVFEQIDREVQELFNEAVAHDEAHDTFVHTRLKLRCFEIFQSFDERGKEQLMETIDALLLSDGEAHPAEVKFRAELSELLEAELDIEELEEPVATRVSVQPATRVPTPAQAAPEFARIEHHYSSDGETIRRQIAADQAVMKRAIAGLEAARVRGQGKLAGKRNVHELAGEAPFLDGHVMVCPTGAKSYELTVLGDLHGCYSCLKAAVTQARFFERLAAYRERPNETPMPLLVLLGDYIDRGMYNMNGVLRAVLSLYLAAPEHVIVLRGNHEYFLEYNGQVYGGVKPSEAIDTLKPHVDVEVFREYIRLFDALPNVFLFDRIMFVHGGIPRDLTLKQRYRDLSSLNDSELRFQMMWSDPSRADVIPAALQEASARFAFGRLQAQRFLHRIGCVAMVRGHDKVQEGFRVVYDQPNLLLCTLFSAGGADNHDLPENSAYRAVTPMALRITHTRGASQLTPFAIDYQRFNDATTNAFYQRAPELAFVGG
jgi:hypothetical protein